MLIGRLSIFTKYNVSNLPDLKCCAAYHKHHVVDSSAFAIVILRSLIGGFMKGRAMAAPSSGAQSLSAPRVLQFRE
jgi:hypothetical protein